MRRIILTMAALLLAAPVWAAPAPAEEKPTKPTGTPPRLLAVSGVDTDAMTLLTETQVMVAVPVTKEQVINVNGAVQKVTVTVMETATKMQQSRMSVEGATVTTAGGDKVELADALKRLKSGGAVVVSSEPGKAVDAAWLKLMRPEVLVFVPKTGTGVIGGDTAPVVPGVPVPALPPVRAVLPIKVQIAPPAPPVPAPPAPKE